MSGNQRGPCLMCLRDLKLKGRGLCGWCWERAKTEGHLDLFPPRWNPRRPKTRNAVAANALDLIETRAVSSKLELTHRLGYREWESLRRSLHRAAHLDGDKTAAEVLDTVMGWP